MTVKTFLLTIVTPDETILSEKKVNSVVIPSVNGQLGVLHGHAPLMLQLSSGILKYTCGDKTEIFGLSGGFAEIYDNKVLVLAEQAELSREIDEEQAKQELRKARNTTVKGNAVDIDEANAALARAVVRTKIAEYKKRH